METDAQEGLPDGQQAWGDAEETATAGDERSANVLRIVALAQTLAAAETAVLVGDGPRAIDSLRNLQRYASLLVDTLEDGNPA